MFFTRLPILSEQRHDLRIDRLFESIALGRHLGQLSSDLREACAFLYLFGGTAFAIVRLADRAEIAAMIVHRLDLIEIGLAVCARRPCQAHSRTFQDRLCRPPNFVKAAR